MIQVPIFGDKRELAFCAFCGGETGTRDHCPSRVLLDDPYPDNLPVVPACGRCNWRFSADEEYLACLVACVIAGSTEPSRITRPKIRRILTDGRALRARIEQQRAESAGGALFKPEMGRVLSIVTKLAQGHALWELHSPCPEPPDEIYVTPIGLMSAKQRHALEFPGVTALWPECGSRAMQRLAAADLARGAPWIVVQAGLYRFHASPDPRATIRIVISEYLAC